MKTVGPKSLSSHTARRPAFWSSIILAFFATLLASTVVRATPPIDLGPTQRQGYVLAVDVHNNIDVAILTPGGVSFTQSTDGGNTFSGPITVASSTTLAGLQMSLDGNGNIYLLWQDWPSQQGFLSVSTDGVSFSTPTMLNGGTACGSGPCTQDPFNYPQLSVTPGGRITVGFFGTPSDSTAGPFSAESGDGGATFSTVRVADSHHFVGNQFVNVTGPSEEQYVIWGATDGQLYSSGSFDGGQTFSPAVNISGPQGGGGPHAIVDSSGNLDVAWAEFSTVDELRKLMFATSTDQGNTFSTPVTIATAPEFGDVGQEQIVVDNAGAIDIAFERFLNVTADGTLTFARSIDGGATFSSLTVASPAFHPAITLDACGAVNVAWYNGAGGTSDILFANSSDGVTFSDPANLTMNPPNQFASQPRLATDSLGNIFGVWSNGPQQAPHTFFSVIATCGH